MSGRDHGGNADAARARFGGAPEDWIDLSTGINRQPYPVPKLSIDTWADLPTETALRRLIDVARSAYRVPSNVECLPLAGAQAAIQLAPRLRSPGRAVIAGPTYNEHAAAFRTAGWTVMEVEGLDGCADGDAAVVVNPNNPDGRVRSPEALLDLADRVPLLIVDESFADPIPEVSVIPYLSRPGLLVLRSFGKFYGLAGVRLGFACGAPADIAVLREAAGPWAVSGPALALGQAALSDGDWRDATVARLASEWPRLDALAARAGWQRVGGTHLFSLYRTPDAVEAQEHLAQHQIWSRIFPYDPHWIRLGFPGSAEEWSRVEAALSDA